MFAPSLKDNAGASPIVVGFPTVLPWQFDAESVASDEHSSKSEKSKKKKDKGKDKPTTAGGSSAELSTPVPPSKLKQNVRHLLTLRHRNQPSMTFTTALICLDHATIVLE